MNCQIPDCERDALNGETFCGFHGGRIHFTNRRCYCDACIAEREAERQAEPMLRLVRQVAEINRCYGDEPLMRVDMVDERIAAMAA